MHTMTLEEIDCVSGGNFLVEIAKAVVTEVVIEGAKALGNAMNEHAANCNQVIHDDPAGRGRALL